jgi:uncharacterized membrane protein
MSTYDPINFDKIVNVQLNRWREIRKEKLKSLDIEFMKALEDDNIELKNRISQLKRELRNVTNFDFSSISIDQIENYYPDCLLN